jgi:cell division protein FtsX
MERGDSMEIVIAIVILIFLGTLLSIEGMVRKINVSNREIVELLKEIKQKK